MKKKSSVILAILVVMMLGANALIFYNAIIKPDSAQDSALWVSSSDKEPTQNSDVSSTAQTTATTQAENVTTATTAFVPTASMEDYKQYVAVLTNGAALRSSPASDATVRAKMKEGGRAVLLDSNGMWVQIQYEDVVGWTYLSNIKPIIDKETEKLYFSSIPQPSADDAVQSLSGTAIAKTVDSIRSIYDCTGLSLAVIKDGKVAYDYQSGYADIGHKRSLTNQTKFRIASISKVFTSMMAMAMVDSGELDLDRDVGEIMGYAVRNPYRADKVITTRMLLSHTSSFNDLMLSGRALSRIIAAKESYMCVTPGKHFNYSNFGIGVAGAVMEKTSGKVLSEIADELFFEPMGIDASFDGIYLDEKQDVADGISGRDLERSAKEIVNASEGKAPGENYMSAAGGLIISADDMARVVSILLNDGQYNGKQYISLQSLEEMHEVQIECELFDQCIGVRASENVIEGRTVYYHTGAAYGVFSLIVYDPADGSGVVILTTGATDLKGEYGVRRVCEDTANLLYEHIIEQN